MILFHLEFYQNFKNHHAGKSNKTYFVNMFLIILDYYFLEPKFLLLPLRPQAINHVFRFISKKILCHMFWSHVIFCCLDYMTWIANSFAEHGSSKNSKTSFMSSGDKPILTLKISVTNFCKFQYTADLDIKVVVLVQNSFDWIGFC